ncbi:hypothetical protein D3C80_1279700 [compost metagenome]
MGRRDLGFRAEQVRGTQLYRRRAQRQGGHNAAMVADAASGNHRNLHCIDDLRHQRQGADLGIEVATEEHPAVPAGFIAHGNDRVAAVLLQPDRLVDGGGAGQHLRARGLDPCQQACLRQAEVKAHHCRLEGFDQLAAGIVERCAVGHWRRRIKVGAQLFVVGLERQLPGRIAGRVRLRWLVAEEVDVERAVAGLLERLQLGADLLQAQGCARKRAQAAGIAHGNGHGRAGGTGHGRLKDRQFDAEQIEKTGVRPWAHAWGSFCAVSVTGLC